MSILAAGFSAVASITLVVAALTVYTGMMKTWASGTSSGLILSVQIGT